MITDQEANTVYFSESTMKEFSGQFQMLSGILQKEGYNVDVLWGAEDLFCRDYMSVQVDKANFVQFVFRPQAYFSPEIYHFISNPVQIELQNKLAKPRYSRILLDGGNVVKGKDKVIITQRVINDNLFQFESEKEIIDELEKVLKCKVIIVPEFPNDDTGHADIFVRFIDENNVFIRESSSVNNEWREEVLRVLQKNGLKYVDLTCPVDEKGTNQTGLYINYLQIGNLIVVPQFDLEEDEPVFEKFLDVFGDDYVVIPFDANWISEVGGVFNSATWSILK